MNPAYNLVFIGDSLTEWYDWQERFPDRRITNLGIAGEPVEGLLHRLDRATRSMGAPDMIFLMTGINNIAMEHYEIGGMIREIVERLTRAFDRADVVVQSILPVDLAWVDNMAIKGINRRLQDMTRELRADYLDIFSLFVTEAGKPKPGLLMDDGVHLSVEGYRVWAGAVDAFLRKR
jgi:lysophospholipase L1-like esterase